MRKPLAIDLFCGLGGWTEGLLLEGWDVIGVDIERHQYGDMRYPTRLIVRDIQKIHGGQFRKADLIVASPPCQKYSYMAMPWSIAKQKAAAILADKTGAEVERLNKLFNECFRIQREASEVADRRIPLIVENVRGAQKWVGPAQYNYGSFYLWGDVPEDMPKVAKVAKVAGFRFDGSGRSFQTASVKQAGFKTAGMNWSDRSKRGQDFTRLAGQHAMDGIKMPSEEGRRTDPGKGARFASRDCGDEGVKHHGSGAIWFDTGPSAMSSTSPSRKMASAMIAKIPLPLSQFIAARMKP